MPKMPPDACAIRLQVLEETVGVDVDMVVGSLEDGTDEARRIVESLFRWVGVHPVRELLIGITAGSDAARSGQADEHPPLRRADAGFGPGDLQDRNQRQERDRVGREAK